jgi:hypothetical protein
LANYSNLSIILELNLGILLGRWTEWVIFQQTIFDIKGVAYSNPQKDTSEIC